MTDPEAALMVTNAIKSIIGGEGEGGDTGAVGLEVTTKAVDATEVRSRERKVMILLILLSSWWMLSLVWRSPLLMTSSQR